MRKKIIAGNWKMHNTIAESLNLVKTIHYNCTPPSNTEVVVAPSFIALQAVSDFLKDSYIATAAQNLFWEEKGAFTGEISPIMIKEAGASYVIIGHSERRQYFGETNETVNKKIKIAQQYDLIPIICIGETLAERENHQLQEIIYTQIDIGLNDTDISKLVIAYEPVWAIGTGKTATPEQAEEVHCLIRQMISGKFNADAAENLSILYGGSVNAKNAKELLFQKNIDGALVGGASLKAEEFIEIIKS